MKNALSLKVDNITPSTFRQRKQQIENKKIQSVEPIFELKLPTRVCSEYSDHIQSTDSELGELKEQEADSNNGPLSKYHEDGDKQDAAGYHILLSEFCRYCKR